MLPLLVFGHLLFVMSIGVWVLSESNQIHLVRVDRILSNTLIALAVNLDPALLFGFTTADLGAQLADTLLHFSQVDFLLESHGADKFEFRRTFLRILPALVGQLDDAAIFSFEFDVVIQKQRVHHSV